MYVVKLKIEKRSEMKNITQNITTFNHHFYVSPLATKLRIVKIFRRRSKMARSEIIANLLRTSSSFPITFQEKCHMSARLAT
jgi:hypothetical protein